MPSNPFRCAAVLLVAVAVPAAAADRPGIDLGIGQATVLHLPRPAKDVVVGNPAVADVTVENPTTVVVFGRKTGGTTLSVLDARGVPLVEASVLVGAGGPDSVAVTFGNGKDVKPGGQLVSWICGDFTCVPTGDATESGPPAPTTTVASTKGAPRPSSTDSEVPPALRPNSTTVVGVSTLTSATPGLPTTTSLAGRARCSTMAWPMPRSMAWWLRPAAAAGAAAARPAATKAAARRKGMEGIATSTGKEITAGMLPRTAVQNQSATGF